MKKLLLLLLLANAIGCASYFTRQSCEKTNWYEYGHGVAMSGRRLDSDDFIKQCQKAEAQMSFTDLDTGFKAGMSKYCTSDNIYDVGKAGKPFSYEMCDGEGSVRMKARWLEGVRAFCTPGNAYRFGASGRVYQNVCPKNLEEDWLAEYRKGRKIYLSNQVVEKEKEVTQLETDLLRQQSQKRILEQNRTRLAQHHEPSEAQASEAANSASQRIRQEIWALESKIKQTENQIQSLRQEIRTFRTEMVSL